MSEFGDALKAWRKRNDLPQKQAADFLQLHLRTYQNWEQDVNTPGTMAQAWVMSRITEYVKPNKTN